MERCFELERCPWKYEVVEIKGRWLLGEQRPPEIANEFPTDIQPFAALFLRPGPHAACLNLLRSTDQSVTLLTDWSQLADAQEDAVA